MIGVAKYTGTAALLGRCSDNGGAHLDGPLFSTSQREYGMKSSENISVVIGGWHRLFYSTT